MSSLEGRMLSLANRAKDKSSGAPFDKEEVDALLRLLAKKVRTKHDFEAVFGSPEGADTFAKTNALGERAAELLLTMQDQKDAFKPNALLDLVLTVAFIALCLLMADVLRGQGLLLGFSIGIVICHMVVHRIREVGALVAHGIGNWSVARGLVDANPFLSSLQMKKWQDQFWQLAVHVAVSAMEFYILSTETWWTEPITCWIPSISEQKVGPIRTDLTALYISQLAIWTYTCLMHRFFDERRRDYFVLYGHHLVTIALVLASWYGGSMRVGLVVLYVHDVSDIFVDLLKMVNYTKLEGKRGMYASEVAYASCIAAWLYYRMWQYPVRVWWDGCFTSAFKVFWPGSFPNGAATFAEALADGSTGLGDWAAWVVGVSNKVGEEIPFWGPGNVLLGVLFVLHCWWFYLLARIGIRLALSGAREASRAEYEGDSEAEDDNGGASGEGAGASRSGRGGRGSRSADAAKQQADVPAALAASPASSSSSAEHDSASGGSGNGSGVPPRGKRSSSSSSSAAAAGNGGGSAPRNGHGHGRSVTSPASGAILVAASRRR